MVHKKPFGQLLFSTVRIFVRERDLRVGAGTGFVFHRKLSDTEHVPLLVTNKHVVQGKAVVEFFFTAGDRGDPKIGQTVHFTVPEPDKHWHCHPDPGVDLAVTPLTPLVESAQGGGLEVFYKALGDDSIMSDELMDKSDVSEEVCFVGYPNGLMDSANLTPVMRRGYTATAYTMNFRGRPEFLVDATVIPGSSGSPVFLVRSGKVVAILGVLASFLTMNEGGLVRPEADPDGTRSGGHQPLGLGVVVKAAEVLVVADDYIRKVLGYSPTHRPAG